MDESESMTLSEGQAHKATYCMIRFIRYSRKDKTVGKENKGMMGWGADDKDKDVETTT